MSQWFDPLLQLIFPDRCLYCRSILPSGTGRPLCSPCEKKFTAAGLFCPGCERFYRQRRECSCCRAGIPLQALFALSSYEQQWRILLHGLKYHRRRTLARPFGRLLGYEILEHQFCNPDLVVPVPLHVRREKERGFNQSRLIAYHTGQVLGKPVQSILFKNRDTLSQTALSRPERLENVRGAFSCNSPLPEGSEVLVIDDIYSTGSTIKEAAAALQSCGLKVYGAVLAYNPRAQ